MTSKRRYVAVALFGALLAGCFNQNACFTQEQVLSPTPPSPAASPSASPSPNPSPSTGLVATEAKVTEIGGDGLKTYAVGEAFTLTYTRFGKNAAGVTVEVPGNPRTDRIAWSIDTGGGVVEDKGSPTLSDAGGSFVQVYNRDLKALAPGTFTARASFDGQLEAIFVGTVE